MAYRLDKTEYLLPATELAPALLGKFLCRNIEDEIIRLRITETECYYGEIDTACHAHKGKTPRTETLYRQGGCAYVYVCYGIHSMLNVVSGPEGFPEAVLIRGVQGYAGPGKLTKALHIDRSLNGENFSKSNKLWLEDDGYESSYKTAKGVGIEYAHPFDRDRLWRFILMEEK
ncbi:MAG TPA: 3-methyladenine DNA glycosylase [Clostridiales bacterium]|nr:3-methyladenine DNA glycosylase [Clostridiales bacterium]